MVHEIAPPNMGKLSHFGGIREVDNPMHGILSYYIQLGGLCQRVKKHV
jgi:hypothetical protein